MQEKWKPVKGFNDYQVSNTGKVRSLPKVKGFGKGYVQPEQLLKPAPNTGGYNAVILVKDKKKYGKAIHILVWEVFGNRKLKPNEVIDHKDSDKLNANINNLRILTNQQNVKRSYHGGKITEAKLRVLLREEIGKILSDWN